MLPLLQALVSGSSSWLSPPVLWLRVPVSSPCLQPLSQLWLITLWVCSLYNHFQVFHDQALTFKNTVNALIGCVRLHIVMMLDLCEFNNGLTVFLSVSGPEFQHIGVGVGHRLDVFSSGVLVLGVGQANKALTDLYRSHVTRDYTLEGELGMATDNFSHTGRLIERTTYDHITRDKLERVLAMMQGSNQKALLTYSKVDMSTQEAYELAVKGELRPDGKSPPIMTGLRLLHFQPPHFTLEVQCLNETQRYLCRILHEVGLELRSTAVCKGVRRTRDGPFTIQHALTHQHWTSPDVIQAIRQYRSSRKAGKAKHTQPGKDTGTASQRQEMAEEAAVTGDSHRLLSVLTSKAFGS
uniref:TruB pseudouridine (psi) synthase family member 2 n=1 Tax=Hucho hucho TaxID=62062 RepID=A0A4W5NZL5_9TELE